MKQMELFGWPIIYRRPTQFVNEHELGFGIGSFWPDDQPFIWGIRGCSKEEADKYIDCFMRIWNVIKKI
jgi:hypothetical protein